jgi:hypothetical protein
MRKRISTRASFRLGSTSHIPHDGSSHLRAGQDEAAEVGQLIVAWDLLRLLLTHHFSLISYPCAFFTQVPLCPENGITFEDIGRIFGPPVLGWPVPAASHDDLVPQALEPHIGRPPQCRARRRNRTAFIAILPPTSRHDMLVLKRADPFRSRGAPRIPLESDREDDCSSRSGQLSPDGSLSHPSPGCFSGGTRMTSHLYSNNHVLALCRPDDGDCCPYGGPGRQLAL